MASSFVHPVVSVPKHALVIARIIVSLIFGDLATGQARRLAPGVRFERKLERPDVWEGPTEIGPTADCDAMVRAEGAFRGTHVGVFETREGWHVFLFDGDSVDDPAVERGMDRPPLELYASAVRVPIERPKAPPKAARDPVPRVVQALVRAGAPAEVVEGPVTEGADAAEAVARRAEQLGKPGLSQLSDLATEAYLKVGGSAPEAKGLAAVAALTSEDPVAVEAVRLRLAQGVEDSRLADAARLLGAVAVLAGRGYRLPAMQPAGNGGVVPPQLVPGSPKASSPALAEMLAAGNCPGTCAAR